MPRNCPTDELESKSQGHPGRPDLISVHVHTGWEGCAQDTQDISAGHDPIMEVSHQISVYWFCFFPKLEESKQVSKQTGTTMSIFQKSENLPF